MDDIWVDRVEHLIKYYWRPTLWLTLVVVMMAFFQLIYNAPTFDTNLEEFLPENEQLDARNQIDGQFGQDPRFNFIYVENTSRASSVLAVDAMREQLDLVEALERDFRLGAFIPHIFSVAGLLDDNLREASDGTIDLRTEDLDWPQIMDTLSSTSGELDFAEIDLFFSTLVCKDFLDDTRIAHLLNSSGDQVPETRCTMIVVEIETGNTDVAAWKSLAADIRDVGQARASNYDYITTQYVSADLISVEVDERSSSTYLLVGWAILGVLFILLLITFRSLPTVIFALLTIALAIITTFGLAVGLGKEFTAIDVAVVPVAFGLGIDYTVHLLRRYREETLAGHPVSRALAISVTRVSAALSLAVFTTVIAFASNIISPIGPVREFGFVLALGITLSFLFSITFLIAAIYGLDREDAGRLARLTRSLLGASFQAPADTGSGQQRGRLDRAMLKLHDKVMGRPTTIWGAVIVATLVLGASTALLRTNFSIDDFLDDDMATIRARQSVSDGILASAWAVSYVLIEDDSVLTVDQLDRLIDLEAEIQDDQYVTRVITDPFRGSHKSRIESLHTVLYEALDRDPDLRDRHNMSTAIAPNGFPHLVLRSPDGNQMTSEDDLARLVAYLSQNESFYDSVREVTFGEELVRVLHFNDGTGFYDATVVRLFVDAETSDRARGLYEELLDDVDRSGVVKGTSARAIVTGGTILTVITVDALQDSLAQSSIISVVFAYIALVFVFWPRWWRKGAARGNAYVGVLLPALLPVAPVILASLWILGTMALLNITLNTLTIMVTSLTIGLGIDYSIHVMERFREEQEAGHSVDVAMQRTVTNTGAALAISALTTVSGFAVLAVFSPMPIIAEFGTINALTIAYSFALATLWLPLILVFLVRFRGRTTAAPAYTPAIRPLPRRRSGVTIVPLSADAGPDRESEPTNEPLQVGGEAEGDDPGAAAARSDEPNEATLVADMYDAIDDAIKNLEGGQNK